MNKHAVLSIIAVTVSALGFAAPDDLPVRAESLKIPFQDIRVLKIDELRDSDLNELMQGQHPEVAVEFTEKTILPISFYLMGNLANLVESHERLGNIEIKQTFYARCVKEELLLSSNLIDWKPFLEFITGTINVSLITENGQPSIVFGSETNKRL